MSTTSGKKIKQASGFSAAQTSQGKRKSSFVSKRSAGGLNRPQRTGKTSLNELKCGEGEGVPKPDILLAEGAKGRGRVLANEDPRLPGDMNLETRSAEPSFSHLPCPSSYIVQGLPLNLMQTTGILLATCAEIPFLSLLCRSCD